VPISEHTLSVEGSFYDGVGHAPFYEAAAQLQRGAGVVHPRDAALSAPRRCHCSELADMLSS